MEHAAKRIIGRRYNGSNVAKYVGRTAVVILGIACCVLIYAVVQVERYRPPMEVLDVKVVPANETELLGKGWQMSRSDSPGETCFVFLHSGEPGEVFLEFDVICRVFGRSMAMDVWDKAPSQPVNYDFEMGWSPELGLYTESRGVGISGEWDADRVEGASPLGHYTCTTTFDQTSKNRAVMLCSIQFVPSRSGRPRRTWDRRIVVEVERPSEQ